MGWTKLKVRRGDIQRHGTTFDHGWDTVDAVRISVATVPGTEVRVRFCDLIQTSGPIYGEVEYCYVYVRDDGSYVAKSAPSAVSVRKNFESEGAMVEVPADASRDSQINYIWLFRRGGGLDQFYRVKAEPITPGDTGAIQIEDDLSAVDALTVNIKLEPFNTTPPDDIIDIEGPYYDRTFVLTATHLYPSRRLSPDTFDTEQVIRVAGADERALWVKKALGGLYIGTTKDIYQLSGTGGEFPDGTMDFTLQNLNIDNPPISEAVAQEGNQLVYLANDGWRAMAGAGTVLITGETSLLYRGKTRHGVSPVNVSTGRFRAAIVRGYLTAITPEGASTTSSQVLYALKIADGRWHRFPHTVAWRSIFREPDGTLIAGTTTGLVKALDTGTQDDSVDIPVVLWTPEDDIGHPFARKDPHDFRIMINTGGADASIGLHLDHATAAAMTLTANNALIGEDLFHLMTLSYFRNIQLRVTGSFSTFRWASLNLGYNVLPMVRRGQVPPSNFGHPGVKTVVGLQLRVCTLGAAVTFTPVLDNVEDDAFTVTSVADEPVNYTHMFSYPARQVEELYLKITGDVELYSWEPIITAKVPLGTLVYDSGPMDLGIGELIWPREVWIKAVCGDDLFVVLYFDGVEYGTVLANVPQELRNTAAKIRVPIPRGYKGRIPRLVITSCEPFFPYWFEFARKQTRAAIEKPPLRHDAHFGGQVNA